jgi:hypothetical protein
MASLGRSVTLGGMKNHGFRKDCDYDRLSTALIGVATFLNRLDWFPILRKTDHKKANVSLGFAAVRTCSLSPLGIYGRRLQKKSIHSSV